MFKLIDCKWNVMAYNYVSYMFMYLSPLNVLPYLSIIYRTNLILNTYISSSLFGCCLYFFFNRILSVNCWGKTFCFDVDDIERNQCYFLCISVCNIKLYEFMKHILRCLHINWICVAYLLDINVLNIKLQWKNGVLPILEQIKFWYNAMLVL